MDVPGGTWWHINGVLRAIVDGQGLDMWQHARLFALTNIAINDTLLATFRAKYEYNFWRPYTAIRTVDDGNPETEPDTEWTSYIFTVAGIPPRSYSSLSRAADESASARVYGGIHFHTGRVKAVELGEQVGKFVFNTHLRPLH